MSDPEQGPKTAAESPEEAPTVIRPLSAGVGEQDALLAEAGREGSFPIPAPGRTLAGRYTVLELLGQGGMGVVLAAYDARLDRRVALKLLRAPETLGPVASDGEARLVREAQALARLNHPHVVAVYDAGTLEDGSLFIAMEHVEGQTLRRWCEEQPRSWRQVLEAYLAAGRGLAAAHAAGLIHRDFKPDNVLVGREGRVRVVDFGLARVGSGPPSSEQALPSAPQDTWSSTLTVPGTLMGTPRYMAPELMRGEPAGVHSDLYAFCVSLYEALYGQLPFAGESMAEYSRARREGRITPPPAQSAVPAWVARIVLQGLVVDPQQRPASIEALLVALEDDPELKRQGRRRVAALASVGVVLAGLAVWGWVRQHEQLPVCGRVERRLDGIWDAPVKERVRQALLGTGLPYAADSAERVSTALDSYAARWVKHATELCEEGQASQLSMLAALRESCLERRRSRLRATTELLARGPDSEVLEKAIQAAWSLPPLEDCTDDKALTAAVPPAEDPAVRARVEALLEQVDSVEALQAAGKYKDGLAAGEALLRQVEPVGYAPLHAQLLLLLARLEDGVGDYKGSEERGREALAIAGQGRDLKAVSQALSVLVGVVGLRQQRLEEAAHLEPVVKAVAESTGDDLLQGAAANNLGHLLMSQGRYPEAWEAYTRAVALREKVLGAEHPDVAASLNNLAMAAWWMGRYEEAWQRIEQSLALREKALGPEHPGILSPLMNSGVTLGELGRYEEALQRYERFERLLEKLFGPEHPDKVKVWGNMSNMLDALGRYEEARQKSELAIALGERLLGPEHPEVASSLSHLGTALSSLGRHAEALEPYTRALAIRQKVFGPEHALVSEVLKNLGVALTKLGRYREARERLDHALAIHEKALGPKHPDLANPLVALGEVLLAQGRPAAALAPLERALTLAPEGHIRAAMQFALARALWDARPPERTRAVTLATQARDYWKGIGMASEVATASQWLAAHGGP